MVRRRHHGGIRRLLVSLGLVTVTMVTLQGCAGLPLAAFSIVAGTGAGAGVGHALDSITYKTFSVPASGLSSATLMTLDRLDMPVMEVENTDTGQTIAAQAGDRSVDIELDQLTTTASRMRVVVKKNILIRDRAAWNAPAGPSYASRRCSANRCRREPPRR